MPNSPRERFYGKLGIDLEKNADPTVPDQNFFRLLRIDEGQDDRRVMSEVPAAYKQQYDTATTFVHIDNVLAAEVHRKLTQAKATLTDPIRVADHREQLRRVRMDMLSEDARDLSDSGVERAAAEAALGHRCAKLGFPAGMQRQAVREVMSLYPWPSPASPAPGNAGTTPAAKTGKWVFAPAAVVLVAGLLHWSVGLVLGLAGVAVVAWLILHRQMPELLPVGISCAVGVLLSLAWAGRGGARNGMGPVDRPPPTRIRMANPKFPADAPAGTFLAKPIYLSGYSPAAAQDSTVDLAVDGKPDTGWVLGGGDDDAWLEIDFGEGRPIDGLAVMGIFSESSHDTSVRRQHPVRLECDEGEPIGALLKESNQWQVVTFEPRTTRKVRLVWAARAKASKGATLKINEAWFYRVQTNEAAARWTGTWSTSHFGNVQLTQRGNWVMGEYTDGAIVAKILSNEELYGTWSATVHGKSGDIRLLISPEGDSFDGRWRSGTNGPWDSDTPWQGTRIAP